MRRPGQGRLLVLALALIAQGCASGREASDHAASASPPPLPQPPPPPAAEPPPPPVAVSLPPLPNAAYTDVRVFFATDRRVAPTADPRLFAYAGARGSLTYGEAHVTVPKERVGWEQPALRRYVFGREPGRYFSLQASLPVSAERWSADLRSDVAAGRRRALLVFVHGYNVPFRDALFRTAQIKVDAMPDAGAAVLLSWASAGRVLDYCRDGQAARAAASDMGTALAHAIGGSDAPDVYVIAHSMGNRVLAGALAELGRRSPPLLGRIREVVMAAPDLDAGTFDPAVKTAVLAAAARATVYASAHDRALFASYLTNNGWGRVQGSRCGATLAGAGAGGYWPLGRMRSPPRLFPPVELIDATAVGADLLGHSYVGDSRSVLADMRTLFASGAGAARRGLRPAPDGRLYWVMPRPAP